MFALLGIRGLVRLGKEYPVLEVLGYLGLGFIILLFIPFSLAIEVFLVCVALGLIRKMSEIKNMVNDLSGTMIELKSQQPQLYSCPYCKAQDLARFQPFCHACGHKLGWGEHVAENICNS